MFYVKSNKKSYKGSEQLKKIILILSFVLLCSLMYYINVSAPTKASNKNYDNEYYYNEENMQVDSPMNNDILNVTENANEDVTIEIQEVNSSKVNNSKIINIKPEFPDNILFLVNKDFSLPQDYVPDDLVIPNVKFISKKITENKYLRKDAAVALEELFKAASDEGLTLCAISGYRSYERQYQIYKSNVRKKGEEYTNKYSAKPGHSEHQTGLAMDVSTPSIGNELEDVFAGTKEGIWLAENAYLYGFIVRYPSEKSSITGYSYEPWHIRYVGKELAKVLTEKDLTLEEYFEIEPRTSDLEAMSYDNLTDE